MALTQAQAVDDVRNLLNEATPVFWTDSEIEDWLAEGTQIISSKVLCVHADDELTLVTSQLVYAAADESWIADCIEPFAVIYYDGTNYKGIEFIHPKQIGNVMTYTAGAPRYYSFFNRKFYIWPLPTSTENGNDCTVLYAKETSDITALQDEYQNMAVTWALSRAKMKDEKYQEAAALQAQFFSELNFERTDKVARTGEGTASVKTGKSTAR